MSYPKEIWGQRFQLGFLPTFLNTSKILLLYIVFHTFCHFFLAVQDVLLKKKNTRKLNIYLKNYQTKTNFFFSSSFLGTFLWMSIMFKHYHFQSGYNPVHPFTMRSVHQDVPYKNVDFATNCLTIQLFLNYDQSTWEKPI